MRSRATRPRAFDPANTDTDRERLTLELMRRHGIVLAGQRPGRGHGQHAQGRRRRQDLDRRFLYDGRTPLPPAEVLREAFANGDLKVMGENGAQYHSLAPATNGSSPTWRWPRSSTS